MERAQLTPAILAFGAAAIWGLWWVPVRYLQSLGLSGTQSGAIMCTGAFVICVIWALSGRVDLRLRPRAVIGATLAGVAVVSFSGALTGSDVVRVVLLFYLAPAWSKVIEWAFLGMAWRWSSSLALAASLIGAFLVLGGELSFDNLRWGDFLALASGMIWAAGAAQVFSAGQSPAMALALITSAAAAGVGMLMTFIDQTADWGTVDVWPALMALGSGMVYVLPILALTLWSAQRLPPATMSFLLTAEIISGVVSAAIFLGEPFGAMQMAGTVLIVFGALSELLPTGRAVR